MWFWVSSATGSTVMRQKAVLHWIYRKMKCKLTICILKYLRKYVKCTFCFICSLAQVTKILFGFTTLITYAVQGYVTNDIIWHKYLSKRVKDTSKHCLFELLVRATIVVCSCECLSFSKSISNVYDVKESLKLKLIWTLLYSKDKLSFVII